MPWNGRCAIFFICLGCSRNRMLIEKMIIFYEMIKNSDFQDIYEMCQNGTFYDVMIKMAQELHIKYGIMSWNGKMAKCHNSFKKTQKVQKILQMRNLRSEHFLPFLQNVVLIFALSKHGPKWHHFWDQEYADSQRKRPIFMPFLHLPTVPIKMEAESYSKWATCKNGQNCRFSWSQNGPKWHHILLHIFAMIFMTWHT